MQVDTIKMKRVSRPLTFLVEGNIGAGKSAFLDRFNSFPNVQVLKEPVEKWRNVNGNNLLQKMYEDPQRWSLTFQTYVQLTMLEQHLMATQPVKLMERSLFSARYCFVENHLRQGKMAASEYEVLDAWFQYLISNSEIRIDTDLIVYLKTSPEVAYARLKKRNRGEEHLISLHHLQVLHNLHEDWLVHRKFPVPAPVLTIDADKDEHQLDEDFLHIKRLITKDQETESNQSRSRTTTESSTARQESELE